MASLNSITLVGNVGQDPKIKTIGDKKVAEFTLATSHGGGNNKVTDWHRIVAWSPRAEIIENFVSKGTPVAVTGSLQYRTYESNGSKQTVAEIIVATVAVLESKSQDGARRQAYNQAEPVNYVGLDPDQIF